MRALVASKRNVTVWSAAGTRSRSGNSHLPLAMVAAHRCGGQWQGLAMGQADGPAGSRGVLATSAQGPAMAHPPLRRLSLVMLAALALCLPALPVDANHMQSEQGKIIVFDHKEAGANE